MQFGLVCQNVFDADWFSIVFFQVLLALGTETVRPSSAAQCVAYIACTELPHGLWPDLVAALTTNVTNPEGTEMMKESTLETIGYICMDIVSPLLAL